MKRLVALVATAVAACAPPRVMVSGAKFEETRVKAFLADRHLTTVGEYRKCAEARVCHWEKTSGRQFGTERWTPDMACNWNGKNLSRPMNCIDLKEATAYCAFRRARVPTEGELAVIDRQSSGDPHHQLFCGSVGRSNPFDLCEVGGDMGSWQAASSIPNDRTPNLGIRCVGEIQLDPPDHAEPSTRLHPDRQQPPPPPAAP